MSRLSREAWLAFVREARRKHQHQFNGSLYAPDPAPDPPVPALDSEEDEEDQGGVQEAADEVNGHDRPL